MKTYIIVNLVGPGKDKMTLFLETNDSFQIKRMVEKLVLAITKSLIIGYL